MSLGTWKLPEGWTWSLLEDVCEINPRRPRIVQDDDVPTSFVPMAAVDEVEGKIADMQIRPYGEVRRGYTYFEENDVLFAKITPSMENGKAAIARGLIGGIGFGTTEFHVLRSRNGVSPEWVFHFIRQQFFRKEARRHFRGAVGQQRVPQGFLETYSIPIPYPDDPERSRFEQRRIVARLEALLDEVREARRLNEQIGEDAGSLMEAVLDEIFEKELADIPKTPLVRMCNVIMGQSPPGISYRSTPKGLPLLNGPTEFGEHHPDPVQWTIDPKRTCEAEDLLFCVRGATTGRMNCADQIYAIGRGLAAIRAREGLGTSLEYVYFGLLHQSQKILKAGRGSTFPNFSKAQLEEIQFPQLSTQEQRKIARYLQAVKSEVKEMQRDQVETVAMLAQMEQAILAQAFRGEL